MRAEPDFYVLGIDYESADYLVRSRFTFSPTQKMDFSAQLLELGCRDVVILSTCNRSEVYFIAERCSAENAEDALVRFFGTEDLRRYLYRAEGEDALRHLFYVAAGLKSAVIGEDQILGQVRQACEDAEAFGCAGKTMTKIFHSAQSAAKQIKTETGISAIPVSTVYIGIKLLREKLGSLAGKRFLLIGTGEMGMLAARYLAEEQAEKLYICCRGSGRELPLPEGLSCELVPFSSRYEYLAHVDAAVTATASPHPVIAGGSLPPRAKPLYILDMAVPPDVDASAAAADGVTVINIDQLRSETAENLEKRKRLCAAAEHIIHEQVHTLEEWIFHSRVDGALASLNRRCDEIAADTERFLEHKIQLSPRERKLVYKMLEASLHRLIREPVARLKALDDAGKQEEYIRVVKALFDV